MNYRELKKRWDYLCEEIKNYKEVGVVKGVPPELFQEQNDIAIKMMKLKSVH